MLCPPHLLSPQPPYLVPSFLSLHLSPRVISPSDGGICHFSTSSLPPNFPLLLAPCPYFFHLTFFPLVYNILVSFLLAHLFSALYLGFSFLDVPSSCSSDLIARSAKKSLSWKDKRTKKYSLQFFYTAQKNIVLLFGFVLESHLKITLHVFLC